MPEDAVRRAFDTSYRRLVGQLYAVCGDLSEAEDVVAGSPTQRAVLWALREGVSEAQRSEGPSIKHDVTLPITTLAGFVAELEPRMAELLPSPMRSTTRSRSSAAASDVEVDLMRVVKEALDPRGLMNPGKVVT